MTGASAGTERKTILCVDDERGPRETLQMVLEHDYNILLADRARGGLKILETLHVDLLMTNFMMPEMTGLELSRELIGIRPDIPIILCTGFSAGLTWRLIRSAGIQNMIMKPMIASELSDVVSEAVASQEAQAETQ